MLTLVLVLALASSLLTFGCGNDAIGGEFADPDASVPPVISKDAQAPEPLDAGTAAHDAGSDAEAGPDAGEPPRDDCPEHAKLLYLIDRELVLWKLSPNTSDPEASVLSEVGELDCGAAAGSLPRAIAVDRSGMAWAEFGDYEQSAWSEQIFELDLNTAACSDTTYEAGGAVIPAPFGMAFVGAAGEETLVLAAQSAEPFRLATLGADLRGTALRRGAAGEAQLAGSAEGKLYGLYAAPTPHIAEIDWGPGAAGTPLYELEAQVATMGAHSAFAFAASGSDFWAFFPNAAADATQVFHVAGTDGEVTTWMVDGRAMIAAGASTCAP